MNDWALIVYCGLITFFTRFSMIALLKKEMFNDRIREVLSYVPSAIFPAIIFPAIFLDNSGFLHFENNPKFLATIRNWCFFPVFGCKKVRKCFKKNFTTGDMNQGSHNVSDHFVQKTAPSEFQAKILRPFGDKSELM